MGCGMQEVQMRFDQYNIPPDPLPAIHVKEVFLNY